MSTTKPEEDIAIIETDIRMLASFRKQLFDNGSILLTTDEHDQFLNHVANTLFAFKIFLEMNHRSEIEPGLQEINSSCKSKIVTYVTK